MSSSQIVAETLVWVNTVGFPLTKVILIGSEIQPVAVSLIKIETFNGKLFKLKAVGSALPSAYVKV